MAQARGRTDHEDATPRFDPALLERARQLARWALIVDTHVDTPYQLARVQADISQRIDKGHFDYVRAREGGLDAVFMAVYVDSEHEDKGDAKAFADATIDAVEALAAQSPDTFVLGRDPDDIRRNFDSDKVTLLMGMENGAPLEGNLDNLRYFRGRGIRYITLCHSKCNHICDSSFDEHRTWHGLSPFGTDLVAAMNDMGMVIDVSHVSDETFYQVIERSRTPVVATHSGCRHFTPGFERNMSDEMIGALAAKGGVIQINFGSIFLKAGVAAQFQAFKRQLEQEIAAKGLAGADKEAYADARWKQGRFDRARVGDVADHIDHVVRLAGIDHVGLGSDFDGVANLPVGLEDVSCYPNLIAELLRRGYTPPDIGKVAGGNFLRVWRRIIDEAGN